MVNLCSRPRSSPAGSVSKQNLLFLTPKAKAAEVVNKILLQAKAAAAFVGNPQANPKRSRHENLKLIRCLLKIRPLARKRSAIL